jgi:DNA primase
MPLFTDGLLDEVRNSVNIVSLVSEYVALRKRGRNHVARCPFHAEKTPSFNVNEDKQIFHCFGCGVGGDAFKFMMMVEHLSFPEAVRLLAERHGVSIPQNLPSAGGQSGGADLDVLRKAMTEAAAFYHHQLVDAEDGQSSLSYLEGRGVTRETIERFHLGYSPARGDALIQHLLKKGLSVKNLEDCGLAKRSDDGYRHYDAFRNRVMFPITDIQGRVIAFGGRALGDSQPKYLNSPETRLYNKSRNLYGLSFSREGIKRTDFAILVEGYMDLIVPYQSGIDNVVASLGTSLTPQQVKLLGRYTREVVVNYDPDSAGIAATQRSLDLFLEEDFRVKVLRLPDGQDPDAFIRKSGAAEYRNRLRESTSYLDFVLETAVRGQGTMDSPRNKIQVLNAVLPYLAKLPNAVERSDYVFQFARKLRIEDKLLLAEVRKAAQQKRTQLPEARIVSVGAMKLAEKRLLQLLLGSTELQSQMLPRCSSDDFTGLATERIFVAVLEAFGNSQVATFEQLHQRFMDQAEQTLLAQLQMEEVPESPTRETAESFLSALRRLRLLSFKQKILSEIAEAAQRKDEQVLNQLIEQRVSVDRQLVSLSRK